MTAIDDWIAELNASRYSRDPQDLISRVETAVAAIALLQGGAVPPGTQIANTFFAGPAAGVPANPTFRVIAPLDIAAALLLAPPITMGAGNLFTPQSVTGIKGTVTNDNAQAGSVGEFISQTVLVGAAIALATGVVADITSIPLTAGDWDVWGNIATSTGAGTTVTLLNGWINNVSVTAPTAPNGGAEFASAINFIAGANQIIPVGLKRVSLAAGATMFLSINTNFAVSTLAAYGFIGARRVR